MTFERGVEFVLRHEDDISDDPHDSGGLTKWGIASKWYPAVKEAAFTRDDAIEIYKRNYWRACKCQFLPAPIALMLFDSAVNQGQPAAIRMLQKALNVSADGVMGQETLQACQDASLRVLIAEFTARRAYQYALHPDVSRFGLGWYRRLAACAQLSLEPL